MRSLRLIALIALVVASAMPAPAWAQGGGTMPARVTPKKADPQYIAAVRAIDAKKYAEAIPMLQAVLNRNQANADAYSWLAYATSQTGDPAKAIGIYQQALFLDPKHRGAHEFIGEAYLQLNDLASAKEHLATLDKLCFFPCSEYSDLKKAIEEYEKKADTDKPAAGR